jgi:hypothetical protein
MLKVFHQEEARGMAKRSKLKGLIIIQHGTDR